VDFKVAKASTAKPSGDSYWIVPPGGTKKVRYRRVSGFIEVLDDKTNLAKRDKRYVGYGVATNPQLAQAIANMDVEEDKWELDKTIERAARKAGVWAKADYGTAGHALSEDFDAGHNIFTKTPPETPAVSELKWGPKDALMENWSHLKRDLQAYAALVEAYEITYSKVEATVVLDEYHVAGTLDRLGSIGNFRKMPAAPGPNVMDLKFGSVDFGRMTKPLQFRCYSAGVLYNHETHERKSHGGNPDVAYVIHVPMGQGRATLIPLDLTQAAKRLELCHQVWQARKEDDINEWVPFGSEEWLSERIAASKTEKELEALYLRTQSLWTEDHVNQAKEKF